MRLREPSLPSPPLYPFPAERPPRESDREEQLETGERELERPLWKGVRERRPEHHPGNREQPEREPVRQPHVAVAELAPGPEDRHWHDREERSGLAGELGETQEEDEGGHEQDPAADAQEPAQDPSGEPERGRRGDAPGIDHLKDEYGR